MPELDPYTVLPIAAFSVAILVGLLYWRNLQAKTAVWAEFARLHGLSSDGLTLSGSYEGYDLRMETSTRSELRHGEDHPYTVTVVSLSTQSALPKNFSLAPANLGSKLLEALDFEDAKIEDAAFDEHFELSGLSGVASEVLRDESVQQHLYEMAHHYERFSIQGGWIHAEHRGQPSKVEDFEAITGPALMLAYTLDEAARRIKGWNPRRSASDGDDAL